MPIHVKELIDVLIEICKEKDIKCTAQAVAVGGVVTGLTSALGGLLMGRAGIALGAAAGGLLCGTVLNDFKSAAEILRSMPEPKKKALSKRVLHAFRDFGIHDLTTLLPLLLNQTSMREIAFNEVRNFLRNEMKLSVY